MRRRRKSGLRCGDRAAAAGRPGCRRAPRRGRVRRRTGCARPAVRPTGASGERRQQDQPVGGRLDEHLDQHGGEGVRGVGVVHVAAGVVGAHQGGVEEVAFQDLAEGVGDPPAVPKTRRDQRVVQVAVRGVVLGAAQFEGATGGGGPLRGVVGVDLVEGPDAVEMAQVAVVVGVVEAGPGPLGEGAVGVDPVRREAVGEGTPAAGALRVVRVVRGGGEQCVPGRREVHGRVHGAPAAARGPVLRRVGGDDDERPLGVVGGGAGEEVLVETGDFGEGGGGARVAFAAGLVVVDEGFEQPVGAGRPQVERVFAAEVVGQPGLAVGVRGRDRAPGAEDRAGVLPPVVELPVDEGGQRVGDFGERGGRGGGRLEVDVGVVGERAGPGRFPVAGPQAGQPGRVEAGRGQEVIAPRREETLQQRPAAGAFQQLGAGEPALVRFGVEVEGDALVGGAVEGEVASEQVVVELRQLAQGALFPGDVQFAGVSADAGEQQHGLRAGHPHAGVGDPGAAAGDDDEGHARVGTVAVRVAGAQGEQGAVRGEDGPLADGEVGGCARQPVVQGDVQVETGDPLDDHVVGAGDEDPAGAARAGGGGLAGGEVDGPQVVAARLVRGRSQPYLEGRVEGLDPLQGPVVGEALGGLPLSGQQLVLEGREFGGEFGRTGVFGAVGADQGVVGDDDPVVVRIAERQGAVPAVAAEEGVLPAVGGPVLVGAVHGAVGAREAGVLTRRGAGHERNTATP